MINTTLVMLIITSIPAMALITASTQSAFADHNNLYCDTGSSGTTVDFVAMMKSSFYKQQKLVDIFDPCLQSSDLSFSKPKTTNLSYTMQLAGKHGAEFSSLAEIQANAADLKQKGADFVSYNIEKGRSPGSELADPVSSIQKARDIVKGEGLMFMVSPSKPLTKTYYAKFAPLVDYYNVQSQSTQSSDPSAFKSYVEDIVGKLRNANPNMPISVQVSTDKGDLQSMKASFSSVAGIVDGLRCWYSTDDVAFAELKGLLDWFNENYR